MIIFFSKKQKRSLLALTRISYFVFRNVKKISIHCGIDNLKEGFFGLW